MEQNTVTKSYNRVYVWYFFISQ